MKTRNHSPRVSKADLARTAEFLQLMGAKVAIAETTPGKVRIVTTDGAELTLGDDEETLDRELKEFRARSARQHGHGRA